LAALKSLIDSGSADICGDRHQASSELANDDEQQGGPTKPELPAQSAVLFTDGPPCCTTAQP
jgi:hypothetical protein